MRERRKVEVFMVTAWTPQPGSIMTFLGCRSSPQAVRTLRRYTPRSGLPQNASHPFSCRENIWPTSGRRAVSFRFRTGPGIP